MLKYKVLPNVSSVRTRISELSSFLEHAEVFAYKILLNVESNRAESGLNYLLDSCCKYIFYMRNCVMIGSRDC